MNIAKIKTLLASPHPESGAWDAIDAAAAVQFNVVDMTRVKPGMSGDEVFAATDATEFGELTDHKQQIWVAFCGRDTIDPSGASNVALVAWVFGGTSDTLEALAAARTEVVSLAIGEGLGVVKTGHIQRARAV